VKVGLQILTRGGLPSFELIEKNLRIALFSLLAYGINLTALIHEREEGSIVRKSTCK
jgi:hypothetical protein